MLNLETDILIKVLEGSPTPREQSVIADDPEWIISAIVICEIAKLSQVGRLRYGLADERVASACGDHRGSVSQDPRIGFQL